MNAINFPALFDDFILAPGFKRADIKKWFKENVNEKCKGVYCIFNRHFEPLYVGSSVDMANRIPHHRYQDKLEGHFDEILFIGIKYVSKGDTLTKEREFIRKLNPALNRYRYYRREKRMNLKEFNDEYENIMNADITESERFKKLADLMAKMERHYNIPLRNEQWEKKHRKVMALYRKMSMSRDL